MAHGIFGFIFFIYVTCTMIFTPIYTDKTYHSRYWYNDAEEIVACIAWPLTLVCLLIMWILKKTES